MTDKHSHAAVDYDALPDRSLWGDEDQPTLKAVQMIVSGGSWLNLAAGDGRFNNILLRNCQNVVAVDNDERALNKLLRLTPPEAADRLMTKTMDLTMPFPFPVSSFDGCFCTATLHIFDHAILQSTAAEIIRVVRPAGQIILDFLTDIERRLPDGNLYIYPGEASYTVKEGRAMLEKCFKGHCFDIFQYQRGPAPRVIGAVSYMIQSQCLLLTCKIQK